MATRQPLKRAEFLQSFGVVAELAWKSSAQLSKGIARVAP